MLRKLQVLSNNLKVSDLVKRSGSAVVFVLLILGPLFIPETRYAFGLYSILGFFTLRELLNMTHTDGQRFHWSYLSYAVLTLLAYNFFYGLGLTNSLFILGLVATSLAISIKELFQTGGSPFQNVASQIWAPIFIALSFLGIFYFMNYRTDLPSLYITISVFSLIWINDTGAYLFGRKIGKTKLFERLSPNKTWEGSIGGLMCAMLAAVALSFIEGMPSLLIMIGFAATSVVSGSLGDLFESRLKRDAGVKDSGVFLPGHGGFFDRFDAMILAVPAAILYFEVVLPK